MSIPELRGKAQTVLGPIDADKIGPASTHEHLIIDMSVWFRALEPTGAYERYMAFQPVSFDNLWYVRYHPMKNLDNVMLNDENIAIEEAKFFQRAGGRTMVDASNIGLGREPVVLARIARAAGINVIMGSGWYVPEACPADVKLNEETVAEQIIRDIKVGVGNTGIRSGIIGEIGFSQLPLPESDRMRLRGVALAQKETGAAILIHPANSPRNPFDIVETLAKAGADVSRVIMSHIDRTICTDANHAVRVELAKTGCVLEYDIFGVEGYYERRVVLSEEKPVKVGIPNDAQRIREIMALIDEGFVKQIVTTTDICAKMRLRHYGGHGYDHILTNVVPLMREMGMSEEHIHTITVENPKRLLQFV